MASKPLSFLALPVADSSCARHAAQRGRSPADKHHKAADGRAGGHARAGRQQRRRQQGGFRQAGLQGPWAPGAALEGM